MITVSNLTKRFGRLTAVDNLSFTVEPGEIVGFLGPNGAGKTTTLRILSCFLPATAGKVTIAGYDVLTHSLEVRKRIGYLPENVPLYPDMRVIEYLRFRGELKGLSGKKLRVRTGEVMDVCGLDEVRRGVIGRLSKGFRQRVGLADSLLHEPEVLILDEPTIGLDPNQIRSIRQFIKGLAPRHTVLLSSHILPEVEMMCRRVMIIHRGRIVASDTPENLVGRMKGNAHIRIEIQGNPEAVTGALSAIPGILKVSREPDGDWGRYDCECRSESDLRGDLFKAVTANGWAMREMTLEKQNLEDVFVAMTTREEGSA